LNNKKAKLLRKLAQKITQVQTSYFNKRSAKYGDLISYEMTEQHVLNPKSVKAVYNTLKSLEDIDTLSLEELTVLVESESSARVQELIQKDYKVVAI
jgi:hypothetical protein